MMPTMMIETQIDIDKENSEKHISLREAAIRRLKNGIEHHDDGKSYEILEKSVYYFGKLCTLFYVSLRKMP